MIYKFFIKVISLGIFSVFFFSMDLNAQSMNSSEHPVKTSIGAYYFDGWTGMFGNNITLLMLDQFQEREPVWGWVTSTPSAMKEQIDLAAEAGLSFFDFCWYYPENSKNDYQFCPLNHALSLYLKSPNNHKLKYCIMVANQKGYMIGPHDWNKLTNYWIKLFKSDQYLKFENKPLITFYNVTNLISKFGSVDEVKRALEDFRSLALRAGLKGVSIAACASYDNLEMRQALKCGFDIITAYNYHQTAFSKSINPTPINNLISKNAILWDKVSQSFKIPYIPVTTLNWDSRPQARNHIELDSMRRYEGFSSESVYQSVSSLKAWLLKNSNRTSSEFIGLIYAWNEYGEGAWLTPSKGQKDILLDGVKKALNNK